MFHCIVMGISHWWLDVLFIEYLLLAELDSGCCMWWGFVDTSATGFVAVAFGVGVVVCSGG